MSKCFELQTYGWLTRCLSEGSWALDFAFCRHNAGGGRNLSYCYLLWLHISANYQTNKMLEFHSMNKTEAHTSWRPDTTQLDKH